MVFRCHTSHHPDKFHENPFEAVVPNSSLITSSSSRSAKPLIDFSRAPILPGRHSFGMKDNAPIDSDTNLDPNTFDCLTFFCSNKLYPVISSVWQLKEHATAGPHRSNSLNSAGRPHIPVDGRLPDSVGPYPLLPSSSGSAPLLCAVTDESRSTSPSLLPISLPLS